MPSHTNGTPEGELLIEEKQDLQEPKMYQVLLHNDHYTTMEFVVQVLTTVFHMNATQATQIMLDVHKKGQGICGVYPLDIAVTKVNQVHEMAKKHEFPLKCSYNEI